MDVSSQVPALITSGKPFRVVKAGASINKRVTRGTRYWQYTRPVQPCQEENNNNI